VYKRQIEALKAKEKEAKPEPTRDELQLLNVENVGRLLKGIP